MSRAEMPTETDLALIGAAVLGLVSATLRGHLHSKGYPMIDTLAIRYADPDTHPAMYRAEVKSDVVIVHGFWTLTGSLYSLRKHLERALADDNVEDFNWGGVPA